MRVGRGYIGRRGGGGGREEEEGVRVERRGRGWVGVRRRRRG